MNVRTEPQRSDDCTIGKRKQDGKRASNSSNRTSRAASQQQKIIKAKLNSLEK